MKRGKQYEEYDMKCTVVLKAKRIILVMARTIQHLALLVVAYQHPLVPA